MKLEYYDGALRGSTENGTYLNDGNSTYTVVALDLNREIGL